MHPSHHAKISPDRAAVIMDSGETVTFGELDARSNQGARLLRASGLAIGDTLAVVMDNNVRYMEIAWAAQRAGLYLICISSKLTPPEIEYIARDGGAKAIVVSNAIGGAFAALPTLLSDVELFLVGGEAEGYRSWENEADRLDPTPIADQRAGADMLYSSGTTGRPKGIRPPLPVDEDIHGPTPLATVAANIFGFGPQTVYLCPAPLYHAAPLRWCMAAQKLGTTIVVMTKFDPECALALIERYRVTHSQWVPTHFVRMLKLPDEVRARYDLSSLKVAIHAAAPCPVPVKQAMIEWWGPILYEYYAGTENNGMTLIDSRQWLEHPGSVGKAVVGTVRICDEDGEPLPPRTEGAVYFEGGPSFVYHNDPEKTQAATNRHGWTTLGDVGWLDEDGFLYLTDRKSFMIISGGVNIYPQEIENLLVVHPRIADAAVVGAPDPEMGEMVVAVIQPADWEDANDAFAEELLVWLRPQISGVKMPRRVDFMQELPRHPTGKLYKRLIRDAYWGKKDSAIVACVNRRPKRTPYRRPKGTP
ncbi:acyl-CoA synthetase, partial [uncultured Sphingomonas sp.]